MPSVPHRVGRGGMTFWQLMAALWLLFLATLVLVALLR